MLAWKKQDLPREQRHRGISLTSATTYVAPRDDSGVEFVYRF